MKYICIEITDYGVVNYRDINQSNNSKAKDFYYLWQSTEPVVRRSNSQDIRNRREISIPGTLMLQEKHYTFFRKPSTLKIVFLKYHSFMGVCVFGGVFFGCCFLLFFNLFFLVGGGGCNLHAFFLGVIYKVCQTRIPYSH